MILYNTLMGVAAGLALILVPLLSRKLFKREAISPEGWALALGILGVILTFLGGRMAVTWPLTANPPINIMFAEPNLVLGLLLLAAALFLWQRRDVVVAITQSKLSENDVKKILTPISWVVFGLGLILLSCTAAILRFGFVGGAPELEPITGLMHNQPWIENTFFGVLYGLCAIGALLTPFALRKNKVATIISICWITAGVLFLLFSAMNYYTHIGMIVNLKTGTHFKF